MKLLPSTDKARAFLLGLALVAAGLVASPWPWLAPIVPGVLVVVMAIIAPPEPEEGSE